MKKLLKILNPFIAFMNLRRYSMHLESKRHAAEHKSYDKTKDFKYF